jgi:hypothetical protein
LDRAILEAVQSRLAPHLMELEALVGDEVAPVTEDAS